jgi:NAD(P)-dependent dehydrogenase (short-subunit alcohol dehydrogenase family)
MLLENKNAVIYGAAGAVGSAVAKAFAREGARLFLTGRDLGALDVLAKEITAAGGAVETAEVDALDEKAVTDHVDDVVDKAATVDISFNAIGIPQQGMQGIPLTELSVDNFASPIDIYARAHFVTGRAAARHMIAQGSGVVLMHTPEPARLGIPLLGGMSPAWASMEALNRAFSAEWEDFEATMAAQTHRKRATTLTELAEAAAFAASDRAAAMTGTVVNLTGGIIVD